MLWQRALTAVIFAPALLWALWAGDLALRGACALLALLMAWEFFRLTLGPGESTSKAVGYGLVAVMVLGLYGWLPVSALAAAPALGTVGLFALALANPEPYDQAMRRTAFLALGVVYAGGLIPLLALLRELPDLGLGLAIAAVFCTWGADTGAYFAGRAFGRHKLYPKVSPGKTVEGAIGGTAAAIGAAFIVRWLFDVPLPSEHAVALGAIAAIVGLAGDLSESLLKRAAGAKDSSRLIPGHGGLLDRFDAVMFVTPAFYAYARALLVP